MKRFCILTIFIVNVNLLNSQGTWTQKPNVFNSPRAGTVGFSIGSKGYIGTGYQFGNGLYYDDFWEWDQASNAWTQKANFAGTPRGDAVGFSIGNFGYIGTGIDNTSHLTNDFWEWDQSTNTWTKKANFPGTARSFAIGFSIGVKGYIGTGGTSGSDDFWEWNQSTNTWTQKTNYPGGFRAGGIGFAIGSKGYVGIGFGNPTTNDFWEYDPAADAWAQKANYPGISRYFAASFSIGSKGYAGTGSDVNGSADDFWEWDQTTNTWIKKTNYPHTVSDIDHGSFTIGCHGYFACGADGSGFPTIFHNDFWEYTPDDLPPIAAFISGSSTICSGSSTTLTAFGGIYYSWSNGATSNSITVAPAFTTTYFVNVSTDCSTTNANATVTVVDSAKAIFTYDFDPCKSRQVQFINQSQNDFLWNWNYGDNTPDEIAENPSHIFSDSANYTVTLMINQGTACADTFSLNVQYFIRDTTIFIYVPNAFSPNNDGSNDVLSFFRKDNYCIKEFELTIYDRWGEKVFETTDIHDSWDGKYSNSFLNSQILTFYSKIITLSGKTEIKKGNISLIR